MKKFLQSFKFRFFVSFIAIEVIFILMIAIVNYTFLHQNIDIEIKERVKTTSQYVAELLKVPVSIYDLATIDDILKNFTSTKTVEAFLVSDEHDNIFSFVTTSKEINVDMLKNFQQTHKNEDNFILSTYPIYVEGEKIGNIKILFNVQQNHLLLENVKKYNIYLILFEILLSSIIAYLIGKRLTDTLDKLRNNAEKIAKNQKIEHLNIKTKDELYYLSEAMYIMQKQLNNERERFILAIEGAQDGLLDWDLLNNNVFHSERFETMLGYEIGELPYTIDAWINLLHPEDKERSQTLLNQYIHSNSQNNYEDTYRMRTKDGLYKWITGRGKALFDENGKAIRFVAFTSDVDEDKKLKQQIEEQFNRYKNLMEYSSDGIFILNLDGQLLEYSQQVKKLLGYNDDEMKKLFVYDWDVAHQKDDAVKHVRNTPKEPLSFESKHKRKDGTFYDASIIAVKITLNNQDYIYASVRDITEQKKLQKELEAAKLNAERANQAKSDFLANMSHEIRTPLNGLIGLTDMVLNTTLSNLQRDYLEKAKESSYSLLNVINDILDFSKIEAGKLDIVTKEFELNKLLKNVTSLFGYKVHEKNLDFSLTVDAGIPDILLGDSLRLTQVLNNFVGNSVKFTEKGYINIKLKMLSRDDKNIKIQFCVQDSGIGISQVNQNKLFKPFEQLDASNTKKYGGTGLGLMICKQLVELMGGKIWVESQEGVGSAFCFEVELGYISRIESKHLDIEMFKGQKFLIVEDNNIESDYLSKILNSWNIKATVANDGLEALEILQNNQEFDYMILDWNMPHLDGLTLLEKMTQLNIKSPHVLMVTAFAKKELLENAKNRHIDIDMILEKPYTPSTIYNAITHKNINTHIVTKSTADEFMLTHTKNALLVEDNEINQMVATSILERYGFKISLANNGLEAVEMAKKEKYDIVFMDLQMPIMDGFEASQKIREFDSITPIIALSAAVMQHDKELTQQAGMNDHIAKPIEKNEIEKVIRKYFENNISSTSPKSRLTSDSAPQIINLKAIKETLSSDEQSIYGMYKNFSTEYCELDFEKYSNQSDSIEFKELVHKLKGVSGNLKMEQLHTLLTHMQDSKEFENNLIQLKKSLNDVCDEIDTKIIPLISNVSEKTYTLEEFLNDIENYRYIKQSSFDELIQSIKTQYDLEHIISIKELFRKKEYDKLVVIVKKLLGKNNDQ